MKSLAALPTDVSVIQDIGVNSSGAKGQEAFLPYVRVGLHFGPI